MSDCFFTRNKIEVPAISAEQMREIDRIAVEDSGPNLFQMMENAGRNLALLAMKAVGTLWRRKRYLILCGKGGNGGGGICAARHLLNRQLDVTLCLAEAELDAVPKFQHHIYQSAGGATLEFDAIQKQKFDVIIDALIGYSLKGAPNGKIKEMIEWANSQPSWRMALDIPSGIDATSGEKPGAWFKAQQTVTLALPKKGLSSQSAGRIFLADLGLPAAVFKRIHIHYENPFELESWVELHERP